MNVLILAAGTRNKIVQYFKRTFDGVGAVVATDASVLGSAIYDADKYYIVGKFIAVVLVYIWNFCARKFILYRNCEE